MGERVLGEEASFRQECVVIVGRKGYVLAKMEQVGNMQFNTERYTQDMV